jgi:phenylalanyl-tRNA synthetase beta chain
MKISLNWINDFVDTKNINPDKIASDLTIHTCEVEGVERAFELYDNVVIGEIKEILPHPNADKLKITRTDIGEEEPIQIICGGTNIYEGMKCIVAKLGARVLWHGTDEMVMEKVKIRGVESLGMICAAEEVKLGHLYKHDEHQVVDLKDIKCRVGDSVTALLGKESIVFDIDNKSLTNRPDLWGHIGIAREIAAIYDLEFNFLKEEKISFGHSQQKVKVEAIDRCPRFQIVKLSGFFVEDSPEWLKERLKEAGVRAISNIVDVTNYVMLELGQPMHAYDAAKIRGGFLIRLAKQGEKFLTLDGVLRNLTGNEVLVCDDEKILGLGGVMGGAVSEVSEKTTEIYLEAANWSKTPIRKTSTALGLRTEAVSRYEKGLDPALTSLAMNRAISLLKKICPSLKVDSDLADISNSKNEIKKIKVDLHQINTVIGSKLSCLEVEDYLKRLEFQVKRSNDEFMVTVPSFRATGDIETSADIIEEVARLYGYMNIQEAKLSIVSSYATKSQQNILEREIRKIMLSIGFTEVMNYSFVSMGLLDKFNEKIEPLLAIQKPLSSDLTHLRSSLKNRILEVAAKNKIENELRIFEIGHVHFKDKKGRDNLPLEDINLCICLTRKKSKKNVRDIFFDAKGVLSKLSHDLKIELDFSRESSTSYETKCKLLLNKKDIGFLGTLGEEVLNNYGINKKDIVIIELSLTKLLQGRKPANDYKPLPKYPSVLLGMTLVVPEEVSCDQILSKIKESESKLIKDIKIIDIYRGEQIGANKKSIAIDITYYDDSKTLEEKNVQLIHNKIVKNLSQLGVSHR